MKRCPRDLTDGEFDLLIVGGGIFGVCSAWEAASRGLSVALIERRDFGHAASANHFKVIHGGIRYLQHADLKRARESSRERSALLRIAPHLASPLPIVIPSYGRGVRGKGVLRLGFSVFDLLTWDRNRGLAGADQRIPSSTSFDRQRILSEFPALPAGSLSGGAVFYDGQLYSPPRLAMSFVRSAAESGARVANYVEATGFRVEGGRVTGVSAADVRSGEELDIRARVVLNSAGAWAADLLDSLPAPGDHVLPGGRPVFSRDVALVVHRRLSARYGLAVTTRTRDADTLLDRGGRHLFFMPWRGRTLVGVWHSVHHGPPEDAKVSAEEVRRYVEEANQALPGIDIKVAEVMAVNFGLTLFAGHDPDTGLHSFGKRSLLVDHDSDGLGGLVTLIGVRATMARALAERAVDLAFRKLNRTPVRSHTRWTPIFGGEVSDGVAVRAAISAEAPGLRAEVVDGLARNYGARASEVLAYGLADSSLLETLGGGTVLAAEVAHAVEREMAQDLEDVVLRRTDLGTAGDPGDALLSCARIMGGLLAWTAVELAQQLESARQRVRVPGTGDRRQS